MRTVALLVAGAVVAGAPAIAGAVRFMPLGEAVKRFVPEGARIFKVTRPLDATQRKRLESDYAWRPDRGEYVFYVARKDDAAVAYVVLVPEVFNTCFHKYAVGLKPTGEVIETVVVELSCSRSFPINRKAFLGQFAAKRHVHALTTRADIDAVTGATLSSEATATAVRKAVSLHHLLFGGGAPAAVDAAVRAAREAGAASIQRAIETGETTPRSPATPR